MIFVNLEESHLRDSTRTSLRRCKEKVIDPNLTWDQSVEAAGNRWKSWRKTKAAQNVVQVLRSATAGSGLCCYCEHDRAVQIEHIYNKKLFPQFTFSFDNHLLVCAECNHRKLDAHAVFVSENDDAIIEYPKSGPRAQPPRAGSVFIDPRSEDPMDYFWLDLATGVLKVHPNASSRKAIMAEYTRSLLELNIAEEFPDKRAAAVDQYVHAIQQYIGCRDAINISEVVRFFPSRHLPIDHGKSLVELKEIGQRHWRNELKQNHFPTIWREMKRQYALNPTAFARNHPSIAQALDAVPELLQ